MFVFLFLEGEGWAAGRVCVGWAVRTFLDVLDLLDMVDGGGVGRLRLVHPPLQVLVKYRRPGFCWCVEGSPPVEPGG